MLGFCLNVFVFTAGERKTSYQFGVHTESQWNTRSEWIIAAQSDREMKEWIDAFKVSYVCVKYIIQ